MVPLEYQLFSLASITLYGGLHLWLRRHHGNGLPAPLWLALVILLISGFFLVRHAEEADRENLRPSGSDDRGAGVSAESASDPIAGAQTRHLWMAILGLIVVGASGTWIAILHRSLALRQQALTDNSRAFQGLIDHLPHACWALDANGRFTQFNAAARLEWGANPLGQSFSDNPLKLPDDVFNRWQDRLRRATCGELIDQVDVCLSPGRTRHLHTVITAVRQAEQVTGTIATQIEITAYVEAEAVHRAATDTRAMHLQQTALGAIECDSRLVITAWNPAAEALWGIPASSAIGHDGIELLFNPPERGIARTRWTEQLEGRGPRQFESTHTLNDGSHRLCEWHLTPLVGPAGGVIGLAALVQDLTAKTARQARLIQNQRLDSVGRFAGGLSAELSRSLKPAVEHLDQLETAIGRNLTLMEMILPIRTALTRTSELNHRLADLSDLPPADRVSWLPINPIVQSAVATIHGQLDARIRLLLLLGGDLSHLPLLPGLLEKAVTQLLFNARDAVLRRLSHGASSPDWKPIIRVTTSYVSAAPPASGDRSTTAPQKCQCLEISDTGDGLDEGTRTHLFEPMIKAGASGQAIGLGLASTWRAMNTLGGWLELESSPGRGTSARLYLPSPQPPPGAIPLESATPAIAGAEEGKHVLLAEDDELVSRALTFALRRAGHRITCSTDGAAALALIRLEPSAYDLVITDLNMPNLGGRDLLAALHRDAISVPVVVLSGHLTSAIFDELHQLGAAEILRKPLLIGDLMTAIRRHTSGQPADYLT